MYTSTDRAFIIQGVCSSYWLCSASTGIARHELQHSSFMETDLHSHATQRVKCSPRRSQMQPTVKTSLAKQPPACFFCSSQMQYSLLSEYSSTNSSSLDLYLPCKSTSPPPSSSTMPRAPPPLFLSTSFCFLFFFKKKEKKILLLVHGESARQQALHKRPLRLDVAAFIFLDEHGEDLERGVEAQVRGALPPFHARDADAGL